MSLKGNRKYTSIVASEFLCRRELGGEISLEAAAHTLGKRENTSIFYFKIGEELLEIRKPVQGERKGK